MKHFRLLLALVVSLFGMSGYAQEASAFGEGQFFLYNVSEDAFLCGGNNWGTQASVDKMGVMNCTLAENSNGGYTICTGNNGTRDVFLGADGYVDKNSDDGNYTSWTFTPVEGLTNTYTMQEGRYHRWLVANGDGKTYVVTETAPDPQDPKAQWKLITRDAILATKNLSSASTDNPIDLTFLMDSPNFLRQVDGEAANAGQLSNKVYKGWTVTTGGNNVSISVPNTGGNTQVNSGCEFWNNTFDIRQTVSVPNGQYYVTFDGFNTGGGFIYANEVETPFTTTESQTSALGTALTNIANGVYAVNKTDVVTVGGGTITIGAKRSDNYGGKWCVLDNCRLYYVGGVDLSALVDAYHAALAAAQAIDQSSLMNATTLQNLKDALNEYSAVDETSEDALTEATGALNTAANAASASIAAYASADIAGYLAKMGGVLDLTNVYTTAAYDQWYAKVQENYNAGLIPDDVVGTLTPDGAYNGGWHSANHIDDVLLSAWTIGGSAVYDYSGALYINTWSTEGNNDGSEMTTPFFEYWTGDGNSLDAKIIQATIPGLNPEKTYKGTALVRVRQQNENTKVDDGITFTVGDGTAVNAADGKTYQTIFFCKTVEAFGKPDASGNLTITFTVNADSHISWLSFKNVMYQELDVTPAAIEELYASILTPHNVQLNEAVETTKATALEELSVEAFAAFEEAVNACNASAAEYATVKTAIDEAQAVYATLQGLPATENALYLQIMDMAVPAYEDGLIESDTRIGSIAKALAYLEQGTRRIVIKQKAEGAVVDRGYPDNNLSCTDKSTGNVQVAPDGLSPWIISDSRAYSWHVNEWSGEGASDGSGMLTPFMEYWRSGSSNAGLDDVTISNTLASQYLGNQNVTLYPNSVYEVSGMIRAYREYTNQGTITGVSIFAGDFEEALDEQAETKVDGNKSLLYKTFTVKGNTDANGNLVFGIKTNGTNANWIAFKNFSIKYYSDNVDDLYKEAYYKMLAKAQEDIAADDYANITGSEKTDLQSVIDNDPNVPGTTSYKDGYDQLKAADDAFTAAKAPYDAYAKAKSDATQYTEAEWPYASADKHTALANTVAATPASAFDATEIANAIVKAYREVVESNGRAEAVEDAEDVTTSLTSYDAAVNSWTGIGKNHGQGYTYSDGAVYTGDYFDGGWSQNAGVNLHVSQDVTLSKGKYLLQISARAATDMTNYTLSVSNGETVLGSVALPTLSANGEAGTFKNGWEDRYVVFDVTERDAATTIKIDATSDLTQHWISFNNLRLIRLEGVEEVEIDEDVDYDNTLAAEGVDVVLKRTMKASETDNISYNTFVVPFDITAAQLKAAFGDEVKVYKYDGNEGSSVKFSETDEVEANVPVLIVTEVVSAENTYVFENVDIVAAEEAIAEGADIDFVGTYAAETDLTGKYFISGHSIYKGTVNSKAMKGTRAYLDDKNGIGVNAFNLIVGDEEITAIQGIDGTITAAKSIYNLQGQKVTTPVKGGIYIIDGKKVLVK